MSVWRDCENGVRVSTCYHVPRCGPIRPGQKYGMGPFGRWVDDEPQSPERELVGWMDEIRSARSVKAQKASDNRKAVRSSLRERYPLFAAAVDAAVDDANLTWDLPRVPSILPTSPELR